MRFRFISPIGYYSPGLFNTFIDTFKECGHSIVDDVKDADCVFFDSHSGFASYNWDELDYVLNRQIPVCYFEAFDYLGNKELRSDWYGFDNWDGLKNKRHQEWANFLFCAKEKCSRFIFFMRKMQKSFEYPDCVYPLELVQYPDHDFPLTSKNELFSRPYDVCFIGASSPWRANAVVDLIRCGRFNVNCFFPHIRIEHDQWLNEHRKAKFFIEADGGGFGSERPYQLITIAPMLRIKNDQRIHENWMDGLDCIEIGNKWGQISRDDADKLFKILNDKDGLYDIYKGGVERLKTHFTPKARSMYILGILKANGIC